MSKETSQCVLFYGVVIITGVINLVQTDKIDPIVTVLGSGLVIYGIMKTANYFLCHNQKT